MSDYIFILESHLDPGQNRVVAEAHRIATEAAVNLWLTGGAMRGVLSGARVADLDFTVERDAIKIGKLLASALGGSVVNDDSLKRFTELALPGGIRASVSNARTEKYNKPGGKPHIHAAGIHEDLARRDFTINAMGLALNRGSRGLLVDPTNGQADLLNRELRATNSNVFFDDPSRILRLIRFQHALGFEPVPKLKSQLENALLEGFAKDLEPQLLARELHTMAASGKCAAAITAYDQSGLMKLLSPPMTGARLNLAGISKCERLLESVLPAGTELSGSAFLTVLTEKLNVRERTEVIKAFNLGKADADALKQLPALAQKLESVMASSKVTRPSHVYEALHPAGADRILMVLYTTAQRTVQDRIRAYYQKYAPQAEEITTEMVEATGAKQGTPKFVKAHRDMISAHLNARPKKPVPEAEPIPVPAPVGRQK